MLYPTPSMENQLESCLPFHIVGSPSPYTLIDSILLNCDSYGNSTSLDGQTWIGDVDSEVASSIE
jgi:hypothetical protein